MKKRILASFLSLVLVLSLVPMSALAADENDLTGGDPVPVCTCETLCTAEAVNMECPICAENIANCMGTAPADEPVGPTVEEQLAELIAALPDPADINPLDEEQVAAVNDQISEIYAFAEKYGLDVENEEIINAVIAALYPVELLEDNKVWDREDPLSDDLIVNQGETLIITAKITISGDVTISGGGTIQRGENYRDELISVPAGANLTLQDVTIDGGADTVVKLTSDEAAIRIEGGTAVLNAGAVIQNNDHVSTEDNSYLHASKPRYYNMGGGIAVYGGTLTMNEGSEVKNNAVTNTNYSKGTDRGNSDSLGGGVAIYENGTFIMNGGEISGNSATVSGGEGRAFGGGVGLMTRGANAEVSNTPDDYKITFHMDGGTISSNSAANGGGGIYGGVDQGDNESHRHTHLDMTVASAICENTSYAGGGGIQVGSADLEIKDRAGILSNTAVSGGGIQVGSASYFTMSGGAVSNNTASGNRNAYGGGIYLNSNANSVLKIMGGEIKENSADDSGGGIQITTDRTVEVSNCTIIGNSCGRDSEDAAVANGGGIQANAGVVLVLTDCTITDNTSKTGHGGGLYISGPNKQTGGTTTLSGTTVIDKNNSALSGPNMYVANIESMTDLSDFAKTSRIGVTWNVDGVHESGGAKVIDGVTEENYSCIVYEPNENQYYVLRKSEDSAVLHEALHLTLRSISPVDKEPIEGVQYTILGLIGETVDFTQVCGFELTGYHIDRWATNHVGQEGYLWNNPYTFSDSFRNDKSRGGPNAIWAPNEYKITYELNGGTAGADAPATHTYGTETALVAPTRIGYTFDGWFINESFSGAAVTSLAAEEYTDDITLYAKWTPNTYTIEFNANGGEGTMDPVPATFDTPVTLPANGFTKADHKFAGWDTDSSADEVVYSDGSDVVQNLSAEPNGTVTLYAVWTEKKVLHPDLDDVTVTYNGQPQQFHPADGCTVTYRQNRTEVDAAINAGIYDVVISREEDDTYAAYHAYIVGGLRIEKAALTVKADNQSIYVGGTLPEYTYTVTGWQGSDTDDLLSDVAVTCPTADANKADDYPITVSGPAELANYKISYENGVLTVSPRSSGGGGGGSSSSSTTTETERNPDGSTTTTVTDKKTGTVTETTKFKDGSTLVVETKKDGTVTTSETAKNGVKVKTVDEPGEDVTATVTIPRSVGEAVVTIPADVDYGTVAVDAKTGEVVKLSVPTEDGMTVKLDGSAELVLVERGLDFTDTKGHWAEDAIDFATAHELFAGTSDTTFTPDSPMTRAMLMTVLARFDGQDTTGGAVWYETAMAWARENGISDGSNPGDPITREQLATMLWRYAGSPAVSGMALNEFGDSADVSGYAVDAMRWAVSEGLISGTDAGLLAPQGSATRAQVATILMRFVEGLTK